MSINKKNILKNTIILLLIIGVSASSLAALPKKAEAIGGVPIDTMLNFHSIQSYLKEFTLDKLAVMVANQILQKMTASIVNWINSGFQGSPAFLTNPEGFFLDAADQVTGEFLDKAGVTSAICSPFSFDLRLNLALNQATYATKRYTCTLGVIVNNAQNAVGNIGRAGQNSGITISGDPNGATIGNFINGDFNQGGWDGFIAYSTEPQNNPIGATLMARSDLQSRIGQKKASINADLNRGQGFLSWQKCTDVTSQYLDPGLGGESLGLTTNQEQQFRKFGNQTAVTGRTNLDKPTTVQKKVDPKSGIVSYQDCQTQTPGSLIGGSLQRQLNVPTDKLVLVKTISDSIDAMLGALVNQMFTQGLAALSGRGSSTGGGSQSYLVQLSQEADNLDSVNARNIRSQTNGTVNSIAVLAENNATRYQEIVDALTASRNNFTDVINCFNNKLNAGVFMISDNDRAYAQRQIDAMNLIIARDIDPAISSTTLKKLAARRQVDLFSDAATSVTGGDTTLTNFNGNYIDDRFNRVNSVVNAGTIATQAGLDSAGNIQQEFQATLTKTEALNKTAQTYKGLCSRFPN